MELREALAVVRDRVERAGAHERDVVVREMGGAIALLDDAFLRCSLEDGPSLDRAYTAFARFAMLHVAPNWLSAFSPAETATNFDALFVRPGCTPRLRAFFVLCECVSPALLGSAGDTGELAVGAGRTVGSAGNTGRRQRALKRNDAVVAMGALRDVRAGGALLHPGGDEG